MDPEKIEAVQQWPAPEKLVEVQAFLGFTNYYRSFIYQYGTMAKPLTNLTKKKIPFEWKDEQKEAFERLKEIVTSELVLREPNPERPFEVETDVSNVGRGAILF